MVVPVRSKEVLAVADYRHDGFIRRAHSAQPGFRRRTIYLHDFLERALSLAHPWYLSLLP